MMEFDFTCVVSHRAAVDTALWIFEVIAYHKPHLLFRRFLPTDRELFFNSYRPSMSVENCPPLDFGFRRVSSTDRYYVQFPGYARYRDIYPVRFARLLWWLESGEDIYHRNCRSSLFFNEQLQEEFHHSVAMQNVHRLLRRLLIGTDLMLVSSLYFQ
ncbi:uncharacterized protein LOC130697633 [Daphnia carinata]|uniref:uncharacterized protein LOC130685649 n=1 Tax=Daphnia carinata TaxID=120202 RepID=UPI00286950DC|nr:uncharacterized protein LOC130685649 [Daphnia carinata]XP_057365494.2 uncharacterized protein LOC130686371 [Daphnia carinata]XP_057373285.2 uncharacterized protein LOC130694152 [Daphnia carinata]XP_057376524.2 uncharacterized protein LOC130697623 [Daphnia carinata]XP_057376529.2 uncharacterized protein LOC130697633 [Daphnia carinata]